MLSNQVKKPASLYARTEHTLATMLQLKRKIDRLTAEYNLHKDNVIERYFKKHDTFTNKGGQVLATYKAIEQIRFQAKKFQEAEPDQYDNFCEQQIIHRFDLKKI